MLQPPKTLIISLSGPSSSGKTTLSRILRTLLPSTTILHEDDFYKPEDQIPLRDGFVDWDCAEALDVAAIVGVLEGVRRLGGLPEGLTSKEDKNSLGEIPISESTMEGLKADIETWLSPNQPGHILLTSHTRLIIFDGFLLYSPSVSALFPYLDIKFFLRTSFAKAKQRREGRSGYVTLEGFWKDPEGYVERVVWPNYVEGHAWMFEGGDVEGPFKGALMRERGIEIMDGEGEGCDVGLEETLRWVVGRLMGVLPGMVKDLEGGR